jgi:hypothetical protein
MQEIKWTEIYYCVSIIDLSDRTNHNVLLELIYEISFIINNINLSYLRFYM